MEIHVTEARSTQSRGTFAKRQASGCVPRAPGVSCCGSQPTLTLTETALANRLVRKESALNLLLVFAPVALGSKACSRSRAH